MKPINRYGASSEVYDYFMRTAKRSRAIDSFLLGAILYFRYFLKLERALNARQAEITASSSELLAPEDDPYHGVNSTLDIWRKDGLIQLGHVDQDRHERRNKTLKELREKADIMIKILGVGYAQLLVSITNYKTKDSNKERSYFAYLDIYLFAAIKQVFQQETWPSIQKELYRLIKSQWFSSFSHVNPDELIKEQRETQRDDVLALYRPTSAKSAVQFDSSEDSHHERPSTALSVRSTKSTLEEAALPKSLRSSLMYKNLVHLRKQQESSEVVKRFRPMSAPSSVCPRALRSERPTSAKMGIQVSRPSTAKSMLRRTLDQNQNEDEYGRLKSRPFSAVTTTRTTSTVHEDTIANRTRVEGVVPRKPRKMFGTLVQQKNAKMAHAAKQLGETEQIQLVKSDPTSKHICLEARSPLITAMIESSQRIMLPGAMSVAPRKSLAVPQNKLGGSSLLAARESISGSSSGVALPQSAITNAEFYKCWKDYEREVAFSCNAGPDIDEIDRIQVRVNGFRW